MRRAVVGPLPATAGMLPGPGSCAIAGSTEVRAVGVRSGSLQGGQASRPASAAAARAARAPGRARGPRLSTWPRLAEQRPHALPVAQGGALLDPVSRDARRRGGRRRSSPRRGRTRSHSRVHCAGGDHAAVEIEDAVELERARTPTCGGRTRPGKGEDRPHQARLRARSRLLRLARRRAPRSARRAACAAARPRSCSSSSFCGRRIERFGARRAVGEEAA